MSKFDWPESVPWLTADDVVPIKGCDRTLPCVVCWSERVFGPDWHPADDALVEARASNAKTPQEAADAWNRAMASLGYTEVYEV